MIKINKICLICFIIICIGMFSLPARSQNTIIADVIGNGGNSLDDGTFYVSGTIGQPCIGTMNNSDIIIRSGFWYSFSDAVTNIDITQRDQFMDFKLLQNFPNPFNPVTTIPFQVKEKGMVTLTMYDITGRKVNTLIHQEYAPGKYYVDFICTGFPSGIYFYHIHMKNFQAIRKMMILK